MMCWIGQLLGHQRAKTCLTMVQKNMETLAPPTGHKKFAICDRSSCENGAFRKAGGKECSFMVAESALGLLSGLKIHLNFVISLSNTGSSYGSSLPAQDRVWSLLPELQAPRLSGFHFTLTLWSPGDGLLLVSSPFPIAVPPTWKYSYRLFPPG